MSLLQALILGLISGFTALLPVSSSGQVLLAGRLFGISEGISLHFLALLHVGVLIGTILACLSDVSRIAASLLGMIQDAFTNLKRIFLRLRGQKVTELKPIIHTVYRKITIMLIITTVVTIPVSVLLRNFAEQGADNLLIVSMGFFVSALILLISSYTGQGVRKPSKSRYTDAVFIGLMQGVSAIPGISRSGMVVSGASFVGFSRKFKIEYMLLSALPAILGGVILEWGRGDISIMESVGPGAVVIATIASAIMSYYMVRWIKKFFARDRRADLIFAVYGIAMGVFAIIYYYGG